MEDMGYLVDFMEDMGDMVDTSHTTVTMAAGSTTTQSTDYTATAAFTITTIPCTDLPWSDNRFLTRKFNRQIVLSCVEKKLFYYLLIFVLMDFRENTKLLDAICV